MKYSKQALLLFSVFFLISQLGNTKSVFSQNNKIKTALEISKGAKIKYVKHGKKIGIWYEDQKYKVWVDSVGQKEIFTKNKTFEINKIEKISIRFKGTMITGGVIGTGGLLITGLGTVILIDGLKRNFLDGRLILTIFGGFIDAVGITVTSIGTSIFFIGKKYKKSKGWKFKAVQIE